MSTDPHVPPANHGAFEPHDPVVPAPPVVDATAAPPPQVNTLKFTRAAALWSALIIGLVVLIILLVFITQNTESVEMTFIAWHWELPLGVQILLAAVLGSLLTVLVGAARIVQLRRAAKKNLRAALR